MPNSEGRYIYPSEFFGLPMQPHQEALLRQMAELSTVDFPPLNGPAADLSGAQVTPETMTAARVALANAPLRDDSLVSRIIEGEYFHYPRWSEESVPLTNSEPLTPGTCHRCGATGPCVPRRCGARGCTSTVCIDLCVECVGGANSYSRPPRGAQPAWSAIDEADSDRVYFAPALPVRSENTNVHLTDDQRRINAYMDEIAARPAQLARNREEQRRVEYRVYGDGPTRPDHYRLRPGECVCGFASYFERDMELHIVDEIVDGPSGIPGRLRRCERCGVSKWCREVEVMRPQPVRWGGPTTNVPLPGVSTERVYRCDDCTRGL